MIGISITEKYIFRLICGSQFRVDFSECLSFVENPASVSDCMLNIGRVTATRLDWTRFVFIALIKLAAAMKLTVHTRKANTRGVTVQKGRGGAQLTMASPQGTNNQYGGLESWRHPTQSQLGTWMGMPCSATIVHQRRFNCVWVGCCFKKSRSPLNQCVLGNGKKRLCIQYHSLSSSRSRLL